jgi:nucleotide-binding universal stress UspA family protein
MFERIVVGANSSEGGQDAVTLARALAAPTTAIHLVLVYPVDELTGLPFEGNYGDALRVAAERSLAAHGDDDRFVRHAVPGRSPGQALQKLAVAERADLLVLGSSHRGIVGRLLLGDVARATMRGAPCPVAVAPRGYAAVDGLRTIVAGFDGTAESHVAVELAAAIARHAGSRLQVMTVLDRQSEFLLGPPGAGQLVDSGAREREAAHKRLDRLASEVSAELEPVVTEGRAVAELVDASQWADLLVIGSRGWGPSHSVMLGSTSDRVAHRAHSPLIVVPRPGDEDGEPSGRGHGGPVSAVL